MKRLSSSNTSHGTLLAQLEMLLDIGNYVDVLRPVNALKDDKMETTDRIDFCFQTIQPKRNKA